MMLNEGASGMMGKGSKVLFLDAVSGDTRDIPPYSRPAPLARLSILAKLFGTFSFKFNLVY